MAATRVDGGDSMWFGEMAIDDACRRLARARRSRARDDVPERPDAQRRRCRGLAGGRHRAGDRDPARGGRRRRGRGSGAPRPGGGRRRDERRRRVHRAGQPPRRGAGRPGPRRGAHPSLQLSWTRPSPSRPCSPTPWSIRGRWWRPSRSSRSRPRPRRSRAASTCWRRGRCVRVAPFRPLRYRLIQTTARRARAPRCSTRRCGSPPTASPGWAASWWARRAARTEPRPLAPAIRGAETAGFDMLLIAGASAITDRRDVLPAGVVLAGGRHRAFRHAGRSGQSPAAGPAGRPAGAGPAGLLPVAQAQRLRLGPGAPRRRHRGRARRTSCAWASAGCSWRSPSRPQPREGSPAARGRRRPRSRPWSWRPASRAGWAARTSFWPRSTASRWSATRSRRRSRPGPRRWSSWSATSSTRSGQALRGCKVRFVTNDDFAEGLSTSLKAGIGALGRGCGRCRRLPGRHAAHLGRARRPAGRRLQSDRGPDDRGAHLAGQARQPGPLGPRPLP